MKKNVLILLFFLTTFVFHESQVFGQFSWNKDALNPILSGGAIGAWDRHVFAPNVLYNPDSARYEMWFSTSMDNQFPYHIGFAVSDDGINWTKHPTAVLSPDPGTWEGVAIGGQAIIRKNGEYKMWYTGLSDSAGIGYATSPDGITWTKHPGNPVMKPGFEEWEAAGPYTCTVMPVPEGYKMWYGGYNLVTSGVCNIGFATSVDGITWQRDTLNNPVLLIGESGQWDDNAMWKPIVFHKDTTYYLWYTGLRSTDLTRQGGQATSPDGIHWTKYNDPVFVPSPGQWDADYVQIGSVLLVGDTLRMWYDGSSESTRTFLWKIGHATMPLDSLLVGIEDYDNTYIPEGYSLSQNFPNPFNPITVISYQLPVISNVELGIYNILGQRVALMVNEQKRAGSHHVEWDASNFSSGVYYYRIEVVDPAKRTSEFQDVKKMILIK